MVVGARRENLRQAVDIVDGLLVLVGGRCQGLLLDRGHHGLAVAGEHDRDGLAVDGVQLLCARQLDEVDRAAELLLHGRRGQVAEATRQGQGGGALGRDGRVAAECARRVAVREADLNARARDCDAVEGGDGGGGRLGVTEEHEPVALALVGAFGAHDACAGDAAVRGEEVKELLVVKYDGQRGRVHVPARF